MPREILYQGGAKNDAEKTFLLVIDIYGLKSSGATYRTHEAKSLEKLLFRSLRANPKVWYRAASKIDGEGMNIC